MKKIVASIGMAAVGASALQTVSAQEPLGGGSDKPWSVSATLRGFYDDNVFTATDDSPFKEESFGIEVRPTVRLVLPLDQTTISLGYVYSMKWYDDRPDGDIPGAPDIDDTDHTHLFDAGLSHAFSERYRLSLSESFAIGQEADLFRTGSGFGPFQSVEGDNIRNFADILFEADLTPIMGLSFGYNNAYFNYDDEFAPGEDFVSNSARLDRMEHYVTLESRWLLRPVTTFIAGYQFGLIDYTSNDPLYLEPTADPLDDPFEMEPVEPRVKGDIRNNRSHYGYVGADHRFTPELSGSIRGGARYNDYYNQDTTDVSPYVKASLSYSYAPQSQVMGRVSYDRTSTDIIGNVGDVVTDAQSLAFYVGVDHRLASRLYLHAGAQYQNSEYQNGALDGENDNFYSLDASLRYEINRFLSTHVGYTFDKLDSDVEGREFDRNRVYLGVTATY